MKKAKRAAVVTALVLIVAMLFSVLFIAHEAEHECTGENCQVCMKISACENALKNITGAVAAAAALGVVCYVFVRTLLPIHSFCAASSPITLKVKLSD
ncbi:MAG: hypothetical protein II703_01540 [Ruminococcus sp.]|nr:hypothetical protein [Ruminococcus sp.]